MDLKVSPRALPHYQSIRSHLRATATDLIAWLSESCEQPSRNAVTNALGNRPSTLHMAPAASLTLVLHLIVTELCWSYKLGHIMALPLSPPLVLHDTVEVIAAAEWYVEQASSSSSTLPTSASAAEASRANDGDA